MGQSRLMILIIIYLTTLSSGFCSEIGPSVNWHNAQMLCKNNKTVLTNVLYNASLADGYYWTGYHVRMSQWIKIIGCFSDLDVNRIKLVERSFAMQFPSTGLCQEYCLKFNSTLFGVQSTQCVCLGEVFLQSNLPVGPGHCHLPCEKAYSNETSNRFTQDCGGEKTYNVFETGFFEKYENPFYTDKMECLTIQCTDQKFFRKYCDLPFDQVCNTSVVHGHSRNWEASSSLCKNKKHAYLFGKLPITNIQEACKLLNGGATGPTWLGVAKEKYISMDGVSSQILPPLGTLSTTDNHPSRCLKCNSSSCMFADCAEENIVTCMQKQQTTTTTTITTTTSSQTSLSTKMTINDSYTNTGDFSSTTDSSVILETTTFAIKSTDRNESLMNSKDDSVPIISIALPVAIFITVGSVVLILGILWKRRQTGKISKTRETQHDTDSPQYSDKNKVEHSLPNNYFVLANTKSDSSVDSEKYTTDKYGENPYNESSDGDYDHLGGNIRKRVEENTYHHAFFSSNEDESDYGLKNINEGILPENPYDHTNTGTYQTTMSDNEYSTISLNR